MNSNMNMMKSLVNRFRLVLAIEGTPVGVRIAPHKTDAAKLVLKAGHPEVAPMLCKAMGVQPGNTWQGSSYFCTEVDAKAFQGALGTFVGASMTLARELDSERTPKLEAKSGGKCPDCGVSDGAHWGFCGSPKLLAD